MKISSKIPSIGGQETSEKEVVGKEKSSETKLIDFASRVDKFEGPDSVSYQKRESLFDVYKSSKVGVPPSSDIDIPFFNPEGLYAGLGLLGRNPDQTEEAVDPQHSRTRSTSDKYKGPGSLQLPEIESKVNPYKGPDSIQPPKIESAVSKYKGPKSLVEEESGVEKYIGLDKIPGRIPSPLGASPEDILDNLPRNPLSNGLLGGFGGGNEPSTDSQSSPIGSRVENYKGPDSIQPPQIESKVEKDKLPDFVELTKKTK
jgi:hypothetical protein